MSAIKLTAYCDAAGVIGFCEQGGLRPQGVLPIISGPAAKVRYIVETTARHAYDNKTLLVPGIPEAPSQSAGLVALNRYIDWIRPQLHDPMAFDADGERIQEGDIVSCEHKDEFGAIELEAEITAVCKNGKVKLRAEGRMKPLNFFLPPEQTHLHQRALS